MGTRLPLRSEGSDGARGQAGAEGGAGPGPPGPARDRRATAQKARRELLGATAAGGGARRARRSAPGPTGIKQCFRAVKTARRIPRPDPGPSTSASTSASAPAPAPAVPSASASSSSSSTPKNPKRHGCDRCGKRFNSPGKLSQHALSHTGELPFDCQFCDKRFNSKFKLVRHRLIHNETRPYACRHCDKTFHRKDHLSNHERIHDPVKSFYECEKELCKKRYTSYLSFRKHSAMHSAEEGNLECKMCSKVFDSREDIVHHLRVHAGSRTVKNETDKKFPCPQCDRKFFTAKDVRRHLVVHTGRRDFLCQFCPQKFGRKDHLVRHAKKAHPDERWQSSTPGPSGRTAPAETAPPPFETEISVVGGEFAPPPPETPADVKPEIEEAAYAAPAPEEVASIVTLPETEAYPDYYIMPGASPYLIAENIAYSTASEEAYDDLVPVSLDPEGEAIRLLERPVDEPLLMSEEEDIGIGLLHPSASSSTTALPAFNQAFQNTAQSPKPPHPPK